MQSVCHRRGSEETLSPFLHKTVKVKGLHTMGVQHKHEVDRLRVVIWALAVRTRAGNRTTLARQLFSGSPARSPSTLFYRCLREGRPWPDFVGTADSPGPALAVEATFPGTLIWLIHPLWEGLNGYCSLTLEHTFYEALAMRETVREIMPRPLDLTSEDWQLRLQQTCEALQDEGSLDALYALALIPRQAYCMSAAAQFPFVARQAVTAIPKMRCLQWMPPLLRQMFSTVVCRTVVEEQPTRVSIAEAKWRRLFKVRLDIDNNTGKMPKGIDHDLECALEGSGLIRDSLTDAALPEAVHEIFDQVNAIYASGTGYLEILDQLEAK